MIQSYKEIMKALLYTIILVIASSQPVLANTTVKKNNLDVANSTIPVKKVKKTKKLHKKAQGTKIPVTNKK